MEPIAIFFMCIVGGGLVFSGILVYLYIQNKRNPSYDADWELEYPRKLFPLYGMTILRYSQASGNQLMFLARNGLCYAWESPGPPLRLGRWKNDGMFVYFKFAKQYEYAKQTQSGAWDPFPLSEWLPTIIEQRPGDVFELAEEPKLNAYRPHPVFKTMLEADPDLSSPDPMAPGSRKFPGEPG